MSVSEQERHDLHEKLVSVFGRKEAATVMSLLPPVGWADVATKRDVDEFAAATRRDFDQLAVRVDELAASTSRDFEQLTVRVDQLGASTSRIEQLAASTKGEGEQLESRLTTRIAEAEKRMLLAMMGVTLTTVIAVSGLAFAAAGLT